MRKGQAAAVGEMRPGRRKAQFTVVIKFVRTIIEGEYGRCCSKLKTKTTSQFHIFSGNFIQQTTLVLDPDRNVLFIEMATGSCCNCLGDF